MLLLSLLMACAETPPTATQAAPAADDADKKDADKKKELQKEKQRCLKKHLQSSFLISLPTQA